MPAAGGKPPRLKLNGDPSENELHASVAQLLSWVLPDEVFWTHFPSGGYRLTKAAQARLFRLGLKAGCPDMLIQWHSGKSMWIELKAARGVASVVQKRMQQKLRNAGVPVYTCRTKGEVLNALLIHDVPMHKARIAGEFDGKASNQGAKTGSAPEPPQGAA